MKNRMCTYKIGHRFVLKMICNHKIEYNKVWFIKSFVNCYFDEIDQSFFIQFTSLKFLSIYEFLNTEQTKTYFYFFIDECQNFLFGMLLHAKILCSYVSTGFFYWFL